MKAARKKDVEELMADRRDDAEAGTFTRYVRAVAARSEAASEMAEDVLQELRRALVREMRWRSLWASPPSFVGILGAPAWHAGADSPLDELVAECYLHVFGQHLRQLVNQQRVKSRIDGLVIFMLRGFLTERQKLHDPLGHRLFEVLLAATRAAVKAEELHVLRGAPAIRNETFLGTGSGAAVDEATSTDELRPLAAEWCNELLPGLVTAHHAERIRITRRLRDHLAGLSDRDVRAFRFKDLLDALRDEVRARWRSLALQEAGETDVVEGDDGAPRLVPIFRPQTRIEDPESFQALVLCVAALIEKADVRVKTRPYLESLWTFLRGYAMDAAQERLPSHRSLEGALGIPRDRFFGLFDTLAQMTRRCRGEQPDNIGRARLRRDVVEIGAGQPRLPRTGEGHG